MVETLIPCCEPAVEFSNLPFHWVQWRTPYRQDAPQPWQWNHDNRTWTTLAGVNYSPERAAQMQWHYVAPAHAPETSPQQSS